MRSCTPAFIIMTSAYDEDDAELLFLQYSASCMYLEPEKSTRQYMRPIFAHRCGHGDFYHLVKELEVADGEDFMRYARFIPTLLQEVLILAGPHLEHNPGASNTYWTKGAPHDDYTVHHQNRPFFLFIHYNIGSYPNMAFRCTPSALSTSLASIFSFQNKHKAYWNVIITWHQRFDIHDEMSFWLYVYFITFCVAGQQCQVRIWMRDILSKALLHQAIDDNILEFLSPCQVNRWFNLRFH